MAKARLIEAIGEILEDKVTESTVLSDSASWDSMAVVMVVAAIDDICERRVSGESISKCETVGDILKLAV